jgi:hypothetical protein
MKLLNGFSREIKQNACFGRGVEGFGIGFGNLEVKLK